MFFSLIDRQGKIVLLKLLRSRSGALVTQFLASRPRDFLALDHDKHEERILIQDVGEPYLPMSDLILTIPR